MLHPPFHATINLIESLAEVEYHWSSSYTGHETDNAIMLASSSQMLIGTEPSIVPRSWKTSIIDRCKNGNPKLMPPSRQQYRLGSQCLHWQCPSRETLGCTPSFTDNGTKRCWRCRTAGGLATLSTSNCRCAVYRILLDSTLLHKRY